MNSDHNNLLFESIDDILCEFFEVVIHNILNYRKLYPETIFELRKKFGTPVYMCIHPGLRDYINECLKAINFFISKRQLHKIFICFHSGKSILERYTFDVLDVSDLVKSDLFLVALEHSMRNCILKLNASLAYMKNLPEKSTFSIRLLTNCYSSFQFNQDPNHQNFPWIQLEETENNVISSEIVPLHLIKTQFFCVQLFIEKES